MTDKLSEILYGSPPTSLHEIPRDGFLAELNARQDSAIRAAMVNPLGHFNAALDGATDDAAVIDEWLAASAIEAQKVAAIRSPVTIPADARIRGLRAQAFDLTEVFKFSANASGVIFEDFDLISDRGAMINHNAANLINTLIRNGKIRSGGYGILSNFNTEGSRNLLIDNVDIRTEGGDCIAWNHEHRDAYNFQARACTLHTALVDSSGNGGFGLSVQGTQGWGLFFSLIEYAIREAIHVEGGQTGGRVVGVGAPHCKRDGVRVLAPSDTQGVAEGILVADSFFEYDGPAGENYAGFRALHDTNGSLEGNFVRNTHFKGFQRGVNLGTGNNVVSECVFTDVDYPFSGVAGAAVTGAPSLVYGDVVALYKGSERCKFPKVIADRAPPAIIEYSSSSNAPGAKCAGFKFPTVGNHPSGGVYHNVARLFELTSGHRAEGTLEVRLGGGSHGVYRCYITWDGATLTEQWVVKSNRGSVSGTSLEMVGDELWFRAFASILLEDSPMTVEFDGMYYLRN